MGSCSAQLVRPHVKNLAGDRHEERSEEDGVGTGDVRSCIHGALLLHQRIRARLVHSEMVCYHRKAEEREKKVCKNKLGIRGKTCRNGHMYDVNTHVA